MGSPKFNLNNSDWPAIGKAYTTGLGLAIIAYTAEFLGHQDFGHYTPLILSVLPVLVATVTSWWKDNRK